MLTRKLWAPIESENRSARLRIRACFDRLSLQSFQWCGGRALAADSSILRVTHVSSYCPGLAKSHLPVQLRPRFGTGRRHHGIICGKAPLCAVFLRRQVVVRPQVTLRALEILSVLQTDNIVVGHRLLAGTAGRKGSAPAKARRRRR